LYGREFGGVVGGGFAGFASFLNEKKTIGSGYLVNFNGIKQLKKYVQNH